MAEWLKATDCKSVLARVRRFESFSAHKILNFQSLVKQTKSSLTIENKVKLSCVTCFQIEFAEVAQLVERQPSKL
jgi:hypothetical protein